MQIAKHKVVSINYRLTDDKGDEIDASEEGEPLLYLHGIGALVEGLEEALEGKAVGDKLKAALTPEQAFGERDEKLCSTVSKDSFEDVADLAVGMPFYIANEETGENECVFVTGIEEDSVTIDGNHPLAGIHVVFDVSVVDIRDATDEEIEHRHPHGPGGHEHDHE